MAETEALELDINEWTLGDMCDAEEAAGEPIMAQIAQGQFSSKTLRALVWITKRRSDPSFTLEQAGAIKVTALEFGSANGDASPS